MKTKQKLVANLAKENAYTAWNIFFEEGHSAEDYEFCASVIHAAMAHFSSIRALEEEENNDK